MNGGKIVATSLVTVDLWGDGLDERATTDDPITLFPASGNSATVTITLTDQSGNPVPGIDVICTSAYETLSQPEWRDPATLAARFPAASASRLLERIRQGVVRLATEPKPTGQPTDQNGQASFLIEAFHVCGNESEPASDRVTFDWGSGSRVKIVRSAVEGLVELVDNAAGGLITDGLVGRHLHPDVIAVLQEIGQAWLETENKPPGMPNYITITAASMRWGGINPPHMTHRFGGTADVRPISTDGRPTRVGAANYSRRGTEIIVDYMRQKGASEIRFAQDLPGVTVVDASHSNHVHVSWLRQPSEPWLRARQGITATLF